MRLRFVIVACVAIASPAAPVRAQTLDVGAGDAIRIEVARIDALVEEGIARVEVDETFRNATSRELEGVYRFRLPEDAVVGAFSMWMDGREKRGVVLDAKEARSTYDAIVRKRRDPGLLEQTGWRDFQVSVYPIPASGTVRVKLVYAHPLRDDLGLATLELPLPAKCGPVGDLRVHVELRAPRGLALVDSPTHPKTVFAASDGKVETTWSGDGVAPDRPFVVRALAKREGYDVALLADRPEGVADGWFVARITPRLAAPPPIARDVVFVVDRSGSMADRKIEQARAALLAGLATLKPGDRFEVVSFASDVTPLGPEGLLAANEENLARARCAADDLVASGGTNLQDALAAALARVARDPDRLTAIVLLTDGDPTVGLTDPARILAKWRESGTTARLFAFGVGDDVKDFLLTKLALEGRGTARYVREEENLELPLAALFDRLKAPLLLDPELEVEGDGVAIAEREPRRLPDLFQGQALLVAGRYRGAGRSVVHLRGRSGGAAVAVDVPVEFPATTPARPHVAQLWAKRRVERLLDDLRLQGSNEELRQEIRRLGLAHQLVTPYTSFLVVEDPAKLAASPSTPNAPPTAKDESALPEEPGPVREILPDAHSAAIDDGTTFDRSPLEAAETPVGGGRGSGHLGNGVSAFTSRRGSGAAYGKGGMAGRIRDVTPATIEREIERSLEWLARHASAAGNYDFADFSSRCKDSPCSGRGEANREVAATGLALLAFLANGATPDDPRHGEIVQSALRWLASKGDEKGRLVPLDAPDPLLQHALGALSLVEAYGSTERPELEQPARRAVAFALAARGQDGAWHAADGSLDVETTAWMVLLLRAASFARIDVDVDAFDRIVAAFDASADATSGVPPPTRVAPAVSAAIAAAVRLFAGRNAADDARLRAELDVVEKELAAQARNSAAADPRYWHFGGLAMYQLGGPRYEAWRRKAYTVLVASHRPQRVAYDDDGSWDPAGPDSATLGRLGTTAFGTLALEVDHRYPRLFLRKPK